MSKQNFILVNTDGLFNTLLVSALIAKDTLDKMEQTLTESKDKTPNPKPSQEKIWEQQAKAIELIRQLPAVSLHNSGFRFKYNNSLRVPNKNEDGQVYIVPNLDGNFVTSVPNIDWAQYWEANPEHWRLDIIEELFKLEGPLNKLAQLTEQHKGSELYRSGEYEYYLDKHEIIPTSTPNRYIFKRKVPRGNNDVFEHSLNPEAIFDKTALRGARRLAGLVNEGIISIRSDDPMDVLGHADAFALYVERDGGGGYLDGRGNIVDGIGGARLFESAKAAERTATSRRLRNSVVVSVEVNVKGLAPGHSAANTDRLREVISYLTRDKLMDLVSSIRGEDISQLREKIDERERQLNTQEQASKKKSIM